MSAQPRVRGLGGLLLLALIGGCATPPPVRDLAGQGAATVALAEISLRDYLALVQAQLEARTELVREETQMLASDRARSELDRFLDQSVGLPADDATANLILNLGANHRRIREKAALELEQIEQATTLDVATLPQVPADKLAAAKMSFAVLAQELTAKEWIELAAAYTSEIAKGVKSLQSAGKPVTGEQPTP